MKKSTIEKIEKEIDDKTKLPYEIKEEIKKEVFTNIAIASIIITYFIFIVLGSIGTIKNVRTIDLNIFSIIFLGIAITLFEIAYRKDKGSFAIYGLESLAVGIFTLFLPYIIFELDEAHKKNYLISSIYIASYYILKSIYISTRTRIKYMNGISDVKEIVKKEKNRKIEEYSEDIEENIISDKSENNINKREIIKNDTTKKRGRPKKVENNTNKNKQNETNIPKKRGRPRKVVANND